MPDDETPPAEPPAAAETPPMKPHHRRTVLRIILVTHLCLALLTGLAVVLGYRHLNGNLETLPPIVHMLTKPDEPTTPLNILVMGSDSRDGAGNDIDGLVGGGERSDTTILIHISADRQEAYGVSLPRDALVDRPTCQGNDGDTVAAGRLVMFNEAFSLGGANCTVRMVEKLTGIYIDHYFTVDFNGFVDMVDAVHGVTVCIPKDVDDSEHGITFEAGVQELSGRQALNYVRERSVLSPNSDIGRMKRQQAFMASMINKVVSADTLTSPNRLYNFLDAATRSIQPDKDLDSIGKLVDLATQFKDTGLKDIKFVTVPFEAYAPDPNRLVWSDRAADLWQQIRADESLGREFSDQVISADDQVGTPESATPSGSPSAPSEEEQQQDAANGLCS